MLKRKITQGILAKAATCKPKINRLYYVMDLTNLSVGLYQSLDMVYSALVSGLHGPNLDVSYKYLHYATTKGKSVIINNRFVVCKTEHIYLRRLKKDKARSIDMAALTPIHHPNFISLPTLL